MKKSKFLLVAFMATLFIGFNACSDDDDILDIKLETNEVNVEKGEKTTVKITAGNGEYTVSPDKEEIATATVKDNEITITAVELGSTTITVKDKEGRTATVTVNVVSIVGTWNLDKLTVDVETKNEELTNDIEEELNNNKLKSIILNDDKTFELVEEAEGDDEYIVSGTYTYEDGIITLTEETEEDSWSLKITELTKNSLKFELNETELYQEEYPEDEVTKAVVYFELTRSQE